MAFGEAGRPALDEGENQARLEPRSGVIDRNPPAPALDEGENQALLERLRDARVGVIEIEPRPVTGARSLRGLPVLGPPLTHRAVLAVLARGLSGNPETERARLRRVS